MLTDAHCKPTFNLQLAFFCNLPVTYVLKSKNVITLCILGMYDLREKGHFTKLRQLRLTSMDSDPVVFVLA